MIKLLNHINVIFVHNFKNDKMKKLIVAALLVVGITAFAQEKEGITAGSKLSTKQKVDFQVKKISKELELSAEQTVAVEVLITKQVQKREAKRAEFKTNTEKERAEMKVNRDKGQTEVTADMKKILTPDQFIKWEKMRDDRMEKMKEKIAEKRSSK